MISVVAQLTSINNGDTSRSGRSISRMVQFHLGTGFFIGGNARSSFASESDRT